MENLSKIDEKKLAEYLEEWFNQNDTYIDHFWRRNPVGKVIKNQLKKRGKWKNRGRGKPKLGFLEMKKRMTEKQNS